VSAHARCRVEQAMIKARHSTTTGTRSGFNRAMMGVEIVPSPNPMTPWTVEPIKIMSPRKIYMSASLEMRVSIEATFLRRRLSRNIAYAHCDCIAQLVVIEGFRHTRPAHCL